MEDFFTFLVIFIFFVLPALQRVLKGQQQKGPPPQQRRPQTRPMPQRRPLPGSTTRPPAPAPRERQPTAEDLIPEDLWAILTGQPRPQRPAPPPSPAPTAPVPAEAESLETQGYGREGQSLETIEDEITRADKVLARRRRDDSAPVVVSLETEPAPEPVRHTRFHERLDALAPAARMQRKEAPLRSLRDPRELRRAFILTEVLGPPKALQDD